jgi:hypothetical protein
VRVLPAARLLSDAETTPAANEPPAEPSALQVEPVTVPSTLIPNAAR